MPKVVVNSAPPGYRIVVDGRGGHCSSDLETTRAHAIDTAAHGSYCTLEQRRKTSAEWSLVAIFEPLGRRSCREVNPFTGERATHTI